MYGKVDSRLRVRCASHHAAFQFKNFTTRLISSISSSTSSFQRAALAYDFAHSIRKLWLTSSSEVFMFVSSTSRPWSIHIQEVVLWPSPSVASWKRGRD